MNKILVVDDDVDLLTNMKSFLKKQGYEVAVTTSCKEGTEILLSFQPDLILLDVNVGDEDGRDMCRLIKNQAKYKHIPVLLISARHEELMLYDQCGASAFLKKPFELPVLADTLRSYL
jgi:DNA-binding response OmpR family regulator